MKKILIQPFMGDVFEVEVSGACDTDAPTIHDLTRVLQPRFPQTDMSFVRDLQGTPLSPRELVIDDECLHAFFHPHHRMDDLNPLLFDQSYESKVGSFEVFKQSIRDHHAIVAGGGVLAAVSSFVSNDLDIYVHHREALSFIWKLKSMGYVIYHNQDVQAYDSAFMHRSRILCRINLRNMIRNLIRLDILIVEDSMDLLDVIRRFDLTFCQTWWDGHCIHAFHPDHIRDRLGWLQEEYVPCFQQMNWFIFNRMWKYVSRGFRIHVPVDAPISHGLTFTPPDSPHSFGEAWAVTTLLQFASICLQKHTQQYSRSFQTFLLVSVWPGQRTRDALLARFGTSLLVALVKHFHLTMWKTLKTDKHREVFAQVFAVEIMDFSNVEGVLEKWYSDVVTEYEPEQDEQQEDPDLLDMMMAHAHAP